MQVMVVLTVFIDDTMVDPDHFVHHAINQVHKGYTVSTNTCNKAAVLECSPLEKIREYKRRTGSFTMHQACKAMDDFKVCLNKKGCPPMAYQIAYDAFVRNGGHCGDGCTIRVSMSLMFISTLLMFIKNIY